MDPFRAEQDAATAAVLAAAHSHGPGKSVDLDGAPQERAAMPPAAQSEGIPLGSWSPAATHAPAVVQVLRAALAPRRWEPWNRYGEHRTHPSPRSAFLVQAAVRVDNGTWALDPPRDLLVTPAGRDDASGDGRDGAKAGAGDRPALATGRPVEVLLDVHPERLPAGYGPLAEALAWLEGGHVAAALAEAAAAAGLAAAWRLRPRGVALTLRPGGDATWQWSRVLARRSSGLGPRGLAPDPRPLPPGVLAQLAAAAGTVPPGSPAGSGEELHHRLAVRGITGTSDGWYAVSRGAAGLRALAEPMAALPRAVGHAEGVADIAGMNVAWVMTAPLARTVRVAGAPGYQRLLLTAGAAAQHVGSAAATQGLFCRPMRNVREAALESAVDAPPDQDFVYLLLIGRSRVRDFPYDLSPPQLPAQASTGDSP